jgi:polyhydroxyalkanoate synthesis regulator phasin
MALDFSKLKFFGKLDARARVLVLLLGVVGFILAIYFTTQYFGGSDRTVGPSNVASAPAGVAAVAGDKSLTAEYQRAVAQANAQAAEAAKMSGTSAIPTQIYTGSGQGCVICSDKSANVKNLIDDWVRQGKISPDVAEMLKKLANDNVSVEEYAAALQKLVKEGKLTPEQARALLEEYKKQHTNANLAEAEQLMDELIKSGELPLDAANELLEAQKKGVSVDDYAAILQRMVREGKISPATAQRLLQQYAKQQAKEAMAKHLGLIEKMVNEGAITPEVAKTLSDLAKRNVSVEEYADALNKLVAQGKLTPEAARALLESYKKAKAGGGAAAEESTIDKLLRQAENEAALEISDLLAARKITPETGAELTRMMQENIPLDNFKAAISQMVQDKKLTPEIGQLKIGDYTKVKRLRDAKQALEDLQAKRASPAEYAEMLKQLVAAGVITPEQAAQMLKEYAQANNASPDEYAEGLKKLVAAGIISPEQAAQLMREYQAAVAQGIGGAAIPTATGAFGALQQRVAQGEAGVSTAGLGTTESEFAAAQLKAAQETAQERQIRLDTIAAAMSGQAAQLIASWTPPSMVHREGSPDSKPAILGVPANGEGGKGTASASSGTALDGAAPALIKGGSILFAVLDTAINSDYPDSPIMATIVDGKFKGDKLLGKITTTKGVSGQMDRVSLTFTLMNDDSWPKSRTITAYAIDPDTARTVMASTVDYHYMMRFGAMMATSFLQGYANAITTSGSSMSQSVNGTITSNPQISPTNKLWVGLGQVGQTLGAATQNYINRPPTVRVDSGVSLGILFMTDVT